MSDQVRFGADATEYFDVIARMQQRLEELGGTVNQFGSTGGRGFDEWGEGAVRSERIVSRSIGNMVRDLGSARSAADVLADAFLSVERAGKLGFGLAIGVGVGVAAYEAISKEIEKIKKVDEDLARQMSQPITQEIKLDTAGLDKEISSLTTALDAKLKESATFATALVNTYKGIFQNLTETDPQKFRDQSLGSFFGSKGTEADTTAIEAAEKRLEELGRARGKNELAVAEAKRVSAHVSEEEGAQLRINAEYAAKEAAAILEAKSEIEKGGSGVGVTDRIKALREEHDLAIESEKAKDALLQSQLAGEKEIADFRGSAVEREEKILAVHLAQAEAVKASALAHGNIEQQERAEVEVAKALEAIDQHRLALAIQQSQLHFSQEENKVREDTSRAAIGAGPEQTARLAADEAVHLAAIRVAAIADEISIKGRSIQLTEQQEKAETNLTLAINKRAEFELKTYQARQLALAAAQGETVILEDKEAHDQRAEGLAQIQLKYQQEIAKARQEQIQPALIEELEKQAELSEKIFAEDFDFKRQQQLDAAKAQTTELQLQAEGQSELGRFVRDRIDAELRIAAAIRDQNAALADQIRAQEEAKIIAGLASDLRKTPKQQEAASVEQQAQFDAANKAEALIKDINDRIARGAYGQTPDAATEAAAAIRNLGDSAKKEADAKPTLPDWTQLKPELPDWSNLRPKMSGEVQTGGESTPPPSSQPFSVPNLSDSFNTSGLHAGADSLLNDFSDLSNASLDLIDKAKSEADAINNAATGAGNLAGAAGGAAGGVGKLETPSKDSAAAIDKLGDAADNASSKVGKSGESAPGGAAAEGADPQSKQYFDRHLDISGNVESAIDRATGKRVTFPTAQYDPGLAGSERPLPPVSPTRPSQLGALDQPFDMAAHFPTSDQAFQKQFLPSSEFEKQFQPHQAPVVPVEPPNSTPPQDTPQEIANQNAIDNAIARQAQENRPLDSHLADLGPHPEPFLPNEPLPQPTPPASEPKPTPGPLPPAPDWTSIKPDLPQWSDLQPKVPDWSNLKPTGSTGSPGEGTSAPAAPAPPTPTQQEPVKPPPIDFPGLEDLFGGLDLGKPVPTPFLPSEVAPGVAGGQKPDFSNAENLLNNLNPEAPQLPPAPQPPPSAQPSAPPAPTPSETPAPPAPDWSAVKPELPEWTTLKPELPDWSNLQPAGPAAAGSPAPGKTSPAPTPSETPVASPSLPDWTPLKPPLPDWSNLKPTGTGGSTNAPPTPPPAGSSEAPAAESKFSGVDNLFSDLSAAAKGAIKEINDLGIAAENAAGKLNKGGPGQGGPGQGPSGESAPGGQAPAGADPNSKDFTDRHRDISGDVQSAIDKRTGERVTFPRRDPFSDLNPSSSGSSDSGSSSPSSAAPSDSSKPQVPDWSDLKPTAEPDWSDLKPTAEPDWSDLQPKGLPDWSDLKPKGLPDFSNINLSSLIALAGANFSSLIAVGQMNFSGLSSLNGLTITIQ